MLVSVSHNLSAPNNSLCFSCLFSSYLDIKTSHPSSQKSVWALTLTDCGSESGPWKIPRRSLEKTAKYLISWTFCQQKSSVSHRIINQNRWKQVATVGYKWLHFYTLIQSKRVALKKQKSTILSVKQQLKQGMTHLCSELNTMLIPTDLINIRIPWHY